jgi:hypothetical protein
LHQPFCDYSEVSSWDKLTYGRLTNTTPSPMHLATVNGAAASIGCLARSIGAAVSGSMFHVGLTSGYIGIPFWTLGAIAATGSVLSWFLKDEP